METYCPACGCETEHDIISRGRNPLGRCRECGDIHPVDLSKGKKTVQVRAIVSDGDKSRICSIELDEGEICRIGDAFVALCGDDYVGVEVTSIERGNARVRQATSHDISALWTRRVEEVSVPVAIHTGSTTVPFRMTVPGEEHFVVGETYGAGKKRFRVSVIKIRGGGVLRKPGQMAEAKRIRRIFAYPL
ncbi:MAG: hypothetical protein NQU46_01040 [Methanolinea sp.]|nr:hypothetical protein [Methanolinea sp.]